MHKIGKRASSICPHYDNEELNSPDHTIFDCTAWDLERRSLIEEIGPITSLSDITGRMLDSKASWSADCQFADTIISRKEKCEREFEERAGNRFPLIDANDGIEDWDSDLG